MATVEFRGETFRLADKIGRAPLVRFAQLAKGGSDSGDIAALAAMGDVLEQCFTDQPYCAACGSVDSAAITSAAPVDGAADRRCCPARRVVADEYDRYMGLAARWRLDSEEILEVVGLAFAAATGRPTGRPSVSSDGPKTTEVSSEDASSLRAQRRLEQDGRADLAVAVKHRREYLKAV